VTVEDSMNLIAELISEIQSSETLECDMDDSSPPKKRRAREGGTQTSLFLTSISIAACLSYLYHPFVSSFTASSVQNPQQFFPSGMIARRALSRQLLK